MTARFISPYRYRHPGERAKVPFLRLWAARPQRSQIDIAVSDMISPPPQSFSPSYYVEPTPAANTGAGPPSLPDAPAGRGPVELATLEELATLSAAETRLGAVQAALAMCRILDDPFNYAIHTRAAAVLDSIMKLLRKASGVGGRQRGRLASVHTIKRRRHRGGNTNDQ
jgi:hypothetical protein